MLFNALIPEGGGPLLLQSIADILFSIVFKYYFLVHELKKTLKGRGEKCQTGASWMLSEQNEEAPETSER